MYATVGVSREVCLGSGKVLRWVALSSGFVVEVLPSSVPAIVSGPYLFLIHRYSCTKLHAHIHIRTHVPRQYLLGHEMDNMNGCMHLPPHMCS